MAKGCPKTVMDKTCSDYCPDENCFLAQNDNHKNIDEYLNEYKNDPVRLNTLYMNLMEGGLFDMRNCIKKEEWLSALNKYRLR